MFANWEPPTCPILSGWKNSNSDNHIFVAGQLFQLSPATREPSVHLWGSVLANYEHQGEQGNNFASKVRDNLQVTRVSLVTKVAPNTLWQQDSK